MAILPTVRRRARRLAARVLAATSDEPVHSIPVFEGEESRRHRNVSLRELRLAVARRLPAVPAMLRADTVVLFAGYPRSGHSLVGAIIDAHPQARVAHELDVLGLVRRGLRWPEITALIDDNSRAFRANGQWWNGYRYAAATPPRSGDVRVVGDKKGDWSVRHWREDPTLLDRLRARVGDRRIVFVVVTRDPYDNIATMTLRSSKRYDRARIDTGDTRQSDLPTLVSDAMVDDYRELSAGVAGLLEHVESHVVAHEDMVGDPRGTIRRLYEALGLDVSDEILDPVADMVAPRTNRTRDRLAWRQDQLDAVEAVIADSPHLTAARDGDRPEPRDAERQVSLVSCAGVDDGPELLPAFLDHYRELGIHADDMHVILNASDPDGPGLAAARAVLESRGVSSEHVWIGEYHSAEMWQRRRDLQRDRVPLAGWVVNADVDEFNVFPDGIDAVVDVLYDNGYLGVQAPMIDRIAADGSLPAVDPDVDPFEQFPREGDLMTRFPQDVDRAEGAGTCNLVLHAACVLPSPGGHGVSLGFTRDWLDEIAAAEGCKRRKLLDHRAYAPQVRRRWRHVLDNRLALLHGTHLRNFPRIRDSNFRLGFPIRSAHFKWHAGFRRDLQRRVKRGDQSPGAARYSLALLELFESNDWTIPPDTFRERSGPAPTDWEGHAAASRAFRRSMRPVLNHGRRQRRDSASGANGWEVRQLTAGTGTRVGHMHCYYDIRVMDDDETRIVAMEVRHHNSPIEPGHEVRVGVVDVEAGGFVPLATTRAWSWQQGPMAQWLPGQDRIVFNDRTDDGLGARILDPTDPSRSRSLDRPVYAVASDGQWGVSIDLFRLDGLRPGYGYATDAPVAADKAPDDDGIWHVDLHGGATRLVVSIAEAVEATITALEERDPPLAAELRTAGHHFWFNHLKLSPDDRRLTCKLRWRHPDGPWSDHQGVSLTMDVQRPGEPRPRLLAQATSHVMWWDDETLYYWDAARRDVMVTTDLDGAPARPLSPGKFDRNVHLRHLPEQPRTFVHDEPYQQTVTLHRVELDGDTTTQIARFPFHNPSRGLYRCDLHPVPTRSGDRVVVSSLADGRRQLFCVERSTS